MLANGIAAIRLMLRMVFEQALGAAETDRYLRLARLLKVEQARNRPGRVADIILEAFQEMLRELYVQ